MKPNKESIVNDILIELEKGKGFKDTSLVVISKYKFTEPTFARYWKIANERYADIQQSTQKKIAEDREDAARERLKKAMIMREESLGMLSNIAKILFAKIVKEKESPHPDNITGFNSTISNISKLEGWNAPTKQAQTDSKGNDVKPIDLSKYLTPQQMIEAMNNEED